VISTHVLDTERGRPAEGVRVELYRGDELLAAKETDSDGRIAELARDLEPGDYRLVFLPTSSPFFRRIELEVAIEGRTHIPLLLSPYGCTTYRGS
jgi:5-hydroxyisourate hydrolase-like protein (transthyretin family)